MATANSTSPPDGTTTLRPNWTKHADYRDGAQTNGPDVDDNYEGTMDVNNDGRMDVISSGWMLRQGICWYENPGKPGVKWESHALLAGRRRGRHGDR